MPDRFIGSLLQAEVADGESDPERARKAAGPDVARGSRPRADSPDLHPATGFSRKLIHRGEVVFLEVGVLIQDL